MSYKVLDPIMEEQTEWKSSAKQYSGFLAALKGGTWLPISFDQIDYIDCGRVAHHEAIVTDQDFIGYHYKMCKRKFYTDQYITMDRQEVVTKTAPKWFGDYQYQQAINEDDYVYDDEGGWLGTRTVNEKLVETSYALAKKNLPVVE